MHWRAFSDQDLSDCLGVDPAHIGLELVGRERAIAAWKKIIRYRSFNAAVIEADQPVAHHRIVGFGASAFVTPSFAENEISKPRPGLNARIIASVESGHPVTLNESDLRTANTHGRLDLAILYGCARYGILAAPQLAEVYMILASSFFELHRGYRINRVFGGLIGVADRSCAEATRVWRFLRDFDASPSEKQDMWGPHRVLAVITPESPNSVPGSVVTVLFHHREPILRLRDCDQQLLTVALKGSTDEELSHELNGPLATVKRMRRITLFERIAEIRPGLFPIGTYDVDRRKRGRQKRRYLLAYVREHPEELRPVALEKRVAQRG